MSMVSSGDYQDKSMVHMLPIIDLGSKDMPCIYLTLSFIVQQSQELELQTLYGLKPVKLYMQSV